MRKLGFSLIEFQIKSNIFKDLKINFMNDKNYNDELFTSLIIGANATGKSYILSNIASIFRILESGKSDQDYVKTLQSSGILYFKVKYKINRKEYTVRFEDGICYFYEEKKPIEILNLHLPSKVLAVSFMVTDKFPYSINNAKNFKSGNIYEYLGIRDTSNASFVGSISNKVSNILIDNSDNPDFLNRVESILKFLELSTEMEIRFDIARRRAVNKIDIRKEITELIGKYNNQTRKDFRSDSIRKITEQDIEDMVMFIKYRENAFYNKSTLIYEISSKNGNETNRIKFEYRILKNLVDLRYISSPVLYIKHKENDEFFNYGEASSGEKHFFYTVLNIISKIESNSLVLIDEPEISLHPNWQYKYINYLKDVLNECTTSHIIIASHSHFMVSDLSPESSSIVSLRRSDDGIYATLHDESTYGWSAEDILYNVFNLFTVRNYYVATEIDSILTSICLDSENKEKKYDKIKKLKYIQSNLKVYDPLYKVVSKALERLKLEDE